MILTSSALINISKQKMEIRNFGWNRINFGHCSWIYEIVSPITSPAFHTLWVYRYMCLLSYSICDWYMVQSQAISSNIIILTSLICEAKARTPYNHSFHIYINIRLLTLPPINLISTRLNNQRYIFQVVSDHFLRMVCASRNKMYYNFDIRSRFLINNSTFFFLIICSFFRGWKF